MKKQKNIGQAKPTTEEFQNSAESKYRTKKSDSSQNKCQKLLRQSTFIHIHIQQTGVFEVKPGEMKKQIQSAAQNIKVVTFDPKKWSKVFDSAFRHNKMGKN